MFELTVSDLYTPYPVPVLLLANLLGYRGPTIAKDVLCLEPSLWAWALGGSGQGLYCLVEVPPLTVPWAKTPTAVTYVLQN